MEGLRVGVLSSSHVLISVFFYSLVRELLFYLVCEEPITGGDFSRGFGSELLGDLRPLPREVLFHPTIHVGCLPDVFFVMAAVHLIDTSLCVNIPSLLVEHRCSCLGILCRVVDGCSSDCLVHACSYLGHNLYGIVRFVYCLNSAVSGEVVYRLVQ